MRHLLVMAACLGLVAPSMGSAAAGEATAYQINPQHNGSTIFQGGLKLPLKQSWSRNMGGLVTYPLIAQGLVFVDVGNVGSYGSVFYALNAATGATVWSQPIPGSYFSSLATYDASYVYVLNNDGVLRAAGHWGVHVMAFEGEPFFGQDRFDMLVWRLKQRGLKPRLDSGTP